MAVQGFDGTLEMNAAGAFDEHDVTGPQILYQPLAGGIGVVEKGRGHSAGGCCICQVLRIALHRDDEIEAGLRGGSSASDVERGTLFA